MKYTELAYLITSVFATVALFIDDRGVVVSDKDNDVFDVTIGWYEYKISHQNLFVKNKIEKLGTDYEVMVWLFIAIFGLSGLFGYLKIASELVFKEKFVIFRKLMAHLQTLLSIGMVAISWSYYAKIKEEHLFHRHLTVFNGAVKFDLSHGNLDLDSGWIPRMTIFVCVLLVMIDLLKLLNYTSVKDPIHEEKLGDIEAPTTPLAQETEVIQENPQEGVVYVVRHGPDSSSEITPEENV